MASTAVNVYDYNKTFTSGLKGKEKAIQAATQQANALTNAKTFKFNHDEAQLERDFNEKQTLAEQKFNREEAATARDWQKMMSDTSHQREVKDLIKAGLNPVLSANTGAQSYTTNAASAHALSTSHASGMANSPAGAMGTIAGSYEGARATRYASTQSSAAMRYSADMAYASSLAQAQAMRDVAETNYKATKYQVDNSKSASWAGLLSNYANAAGAGPSNIKKFLSWVFGEDGKEILFNPEKALSMANIRPQYLNEFKQKASNMFFHVFKFAQRHFTPTGQLTTDILDRIFKALSNGDPLPQGVYLRDNKGSSRGRYYK